MRLVLTLFAALAFSACGGSGSGGGNPPPPPTNSAPIANNVSALTRPATTVNGTLSASDANGDVLTFSLVGAPSNGTVTLSGTGNQDFEYTPDGGFAGLDTFTFTASDGSATSNTATASITVNTPPTVGSAAYMTSDIGTVSGTISDSDGDSDSLTFAVSTAPTKGTVSTLDVGTGRFRLYTKSSGRRHG